MIDYVKYHWKIFLVYMLRKVYKKEIVTRKIRRISKKYSNSDELLRRYIEKYYGVKIGKYTTFYDDILQDAASIDSIGAFCSIAKNVHFTEGNHPLQCITTSQIIYNSEFGFCNNNVSIHELETRNDKSKIGNDVWIGRDVTILPSVNIGDGAVIGTGAVVNRDIPPYAIAVGVPAKVIKYRFTPDEIEKLLKIKWWNWSDEQIKKNIDLLYKPELYFRRFKDE